MTITPTTNSTFAIGGVSCSSDTFMVTESVTKPLTAIVALKLISLGKWNLDELVYKYWKDPDIANDPRNKKPLAVIVKNITTNINR